MNLLSGLHQSILEPILSDWLQVVHLCLLDTAVCNSETRNYFLSVLSSSRGNNQEILHQDIDCFYDWCSLRGVSLRHIYLNSAQCKSPSPALMHLFSNKYLTELSAPICSDLISLVRTHKLRLRRFMSTSSADQSQTVELLELLGPSLERLEGILPKVSLHVAKLCPHLTVCDVADENVHHVLANCPIQSMEFVPLENFSHLNDDTAVVDLKATNDKDNSVLLIGSRGYHVTALKNVRREEQIQFAAPYLCHVKELTTFCEWPLLLATLSFCSVSLTSLSIDCMIMDETVLEQMLRNFTSLKVLDLSNESVNSTVVMIVAANCPVLEKLDLGGTHYNICALNQVIRGCPKLERLSLVGTMDADILYLVAKNLEKLSVEHDPYSTSFFEKEGNLLTFVSNDAIPSTVFQFLFDQNPGLLSVDIFRQSAFGNDAIYTLTKSCKLLTAIQIVRCKTVTAEGLYALSNCKHLKGLEYRTSYPEENSLSLKRLLTGLSQLECLLLYSCKDLDGDELSWIAKCCPLISEVALTRCVGLENHHVIGLIKDCPQLVCLDVRDCSLLTAALVPGLIGRPMKRLRLGGTSIKKEDVVGLRGRIDFGDTSDDDDDQSEYEEDLELDDEEEEELDYFSDSNENDDDDDVDNDDINDSEVDV